jgi:hypothetical protein
MKIFQSWKDLKEDGSSKGVGDTEVIPLVGAARSSKVTQYVVLSFHPKPAQHYFVFTKCMQS